MVRDDCLTKRSVEFLLNWLLPDGIFMDAVDCWIPTYNLEPERTVKDVASPQWCYTGNKNKPSRFQTTPGVPVTLLTRIVLKIPILPTSKELRWNYCCSSFFFHLLLLPILWTHIFLFLKAMPIICENYCSESACINAWQSAMYCAMSMKNLFSFNTTSLLWCIVYYALMLYHRFIQVCIKLFWHEL